MFVVLQVGVFPIPVLHEAIVEIEVLNCFDYLWGSPSPQNVICARAYCVDKQACWVRCS
jgi:hypothetical protein